MIARTFPTPWRVDINITPRVTSVTVLCDDGEDTMVCECYEGTYEQRVNAANLIAAAPELLAALQAMLKCCYDMERNDETLAAVKSAMKAIYKATGEPA
jgi:hypothetical protein